MNIEFDFDHLRTAMRLWRESLDMQIPMHDEFKLHFMQQRAPILERFKQSSSAWLMVLQQAVPTAESKAAFDAGIREIEDSTHGQLQQRSRSCGGWR